MRTAELTGTQLQEQRKILQSRYIGMGDQSIVCRAQMGEDMAAEYLLYKYRSLVRTKVRSYFLMGAEKEDLLQIGMIGLWQAIIDYRADKEISFLSFARICIERHVITAIKTATRQKQTPLNTSISLEYPSEDSESEWNLAEVLVSDETVDPEQLVLRREDSRRLAEMLRRLLSDFEWRVLSGYQVGKSYREIALELRCKTKSVDNALARIKRKVSCTPYIWPGVSDNN
ncbi:MAG: RNA polymerase sporulation sigma factor SigH [Armatimonadota bacterium]|nr:RNA polymerase sporulation sigma factor SigH [Armatimonadota bacterium]